MGKTNFEEGQTCKFFSLPAKWGLLLLFSFIFCLRHFSRIPSRLASGCRALKFPFLFWRACVRFFVRPVIDCKFAENSVWREAKIRQQKSVRQLQLQQFASRYIDHPQMQFCWLTNAVKEVVGFFIPLPTQSRTTFICSFPRESPAWLQWKLNSNRRWQQLLSQAVAILFARVCVFVRLPFPLKACYLLFTFRTSRVSNAFYIYFTAFSFKP